MEPRHFGALATATVGGLLLIKILVLTLITYFGLIPFFQQVWGIEVGFWPMLLTAWVTLNAMKIRPALDFTKFNK